MNTHALILAQQQVHEGPMGPEFGKAAPVGLFVILALLVVVLTLGFLMNKRIRRMERRRAFADKHGIDLFDVERLNKAMADAGYDETRKGGIMYARTEVPQTDKRFEPASGIATGADAIDAERKQSEWEKSEWNQRDGRGDLDAPATDAPRHPNHNDDQPEIRDNKNSER